MDEELEMLELQFPVVFPIGTYVIVAKIIPTGMRDVKYTRLKGQYGVVRSYRTHDGYRWHHVAMDDGGAYDFLMQELRKEE